MFEKSFPQSARPTLRYILPEFGCRSPLRRPHPCLLYTSDAADESTSAAAASSQMKNSTESGKKMSIADRANLVSKLGDAQEDEEEK